MGVSTYGAVDWSHALAAVVAEPDQPVLVAQPIVDLAGGVVAGYELLSRFTVGAQAPPDVWFAHADQLGYAPELTARVVARGIALRRTLPPGTFLTVNVEPHLVSHPAVLAVLRDAGRLDRVVVELTEHVRAPDERVLRAALDEIRAAGGLVAVDDAGTGYAGLGQLLAIRPDIVKLDRELVSRVDTDPTRRAVVELLGDLAGRMDAWLLAEGVETHAELQTLAALGVPLAQGWLFGRPAPPWPALGADAAELVRTTNCRVALDGHVAPLVRDCRRVPATGARTGAPSTEPDGTVFVDPDGRPVALAVADLRGGGRVVPVLAVAPSSSPVEVLRRAMNRPPAYRGHPLACTDASGRLIGVIEVAELADTVIGSSAQ